MGVATALQSAKGIAVGHGDARPVEDFRRHIQVREQDVAGVVHRRAGDEADLVGDEGDGEVGAHRAGREQGAAVRVHAARHVQREHGLAGLGDAFDGVAERFAHLAPGAGAEQRIDDHVALDAPVLRFGNRPQAALGETLGEQSVAFELVEASDLHELHVQPGIARQPGDHVAVASVVAGAADDGEPSRFGPAFAERPEGGAAGAVHQANARNAEIVDCPAVEGANVRPCVDSRDHPC